MRHTMLSVCLGWGWLVIGLVTASGVSLHASHAAADEVKLPTFQQVLDEITKPAEAAEAQAEGPAEIWVQQQQQAQAALKAFQAEAGQLAPEVSVSRWLTFLDEGYAHLAAFRELTEEPSELYGRLDVSSPQEAVFGSVIDALPPPEHWQALAEAIQKRPLPEKEESNPQAWLRAVALRSLAAVLLNDQPKRNQLANEIEEVLQNDDLAIAVISFNEDSLEPIASAIRGTDSVNTLQRFTTLVEEQAASEGPVRIPDLVTLGGAEVAEKLLKRVLTELSWEIEEVQGPRNLRLVEQLIIKHAQELKVPQWRLVSGDNCIAVYEAMDKKFPKPAAGKKSTFFGFSPFGGTGPTGDDYARDNAWSEYVAARFASSTADQVRPLIEEVTAEFKAGNMIAFYGVAKQAKSEITWEIVQALIPETKESSIWEAYLSTGFKLGQGEEVVQQLQQAISGKLLKGSDKESLELELANAYLGNHQEGPGADLLKDLATRPDAEMSTTSRALSTLARWAQVINKQEKLLEVKALAKQATGRLVSRMQGDDCRLDFNRLSQTLQSLGLPEEQMRVLVVGLRKSVQKASRPDADYWRLEQAQPTQRALLELYAEQGQQDQVWAMLQENPYWGAADWAQLLRPDFDYSFRARESRSYLPRVLHKLGHKETARHLLEASLHLEPGNDHTYGQLLELTEDLGSLMPLLESIKRQNLFEERPWIWQAEILRRQGKLKEGEAAARQAISMDPSDGEQPQGDRMRAYAVLAEILAAGGNTKESTLYRQVVMAIRKAEHADELQKAGLQTLAIKECQAALDLFADAYCIQSRLALKLAAMGRDAEAAEHYRKAFELMPDSFGRVESHCFGCEGAFESRMAQSIAEEVFVQLSKQPNAKPQVHYLMAYLRKQQERPDEAVAALWRAVEADPDYFNAWEMLSELATNASVEEKNRISLNLVRLSNLSQLNVVSLDGVQNLGELWKVAAENVEQQWVLPESLIPLPASAKFLEEMKKESSDRFEPSYQRGGSRRRSVGEVLRQHPALNACFALMLVELPQ